VVEVANAPRKTVADVAAWQYYQCNHFLLHDLAALDQRRAAAAARRCSDNHDKNPIYRRLRTMRINSAVDGAG
jgi:hypothetical protein